MMILRHHHLSNVYLLDGVPFEYSWICSSILEFVVNPFYLHFILQIITTLLAHWFQPSVWLTMLHTQLHVSCPKLLNTLSGLFHPRAHAVPTTTRQSRDP